MKNLDMKVLELSKGKIVNENVSAEDGKQWINDISESILTAVTAVVKDIRYPITIVAIPNMLTLHINEGSSIGYSTDAGTVNHRFRQIFADELTKRHIYDNVDLIISTLSGIALFNKVGKFNNLTEIGEFSMLSIVSWGLISSDISDSDEPMQHLMFNNELVNATGERRMYDSSKHTEFEDTI